MTPELDEQIALKVFGAVCVHHMVELPHEIRVAETAKEFRDSYGQDPPDGWAEQETLSSEFFDGDYPPKWCEKCHARDLGLRYFTDRCLPKYSSDIAAAWEVVKAMAEPYEVRLEMCAEGWLFTIQDGTGTEWWGQAETAPEAICMAALKIRP